MIKIKPISKGGLVQILFFTAVGGSLLFVLVGAVVFWHFSRDLPKIITVADYRPLTVTRIMGKNVKGEDEEIGEFFKERRYVIPYEKIPQIAVQAFISAEDDQFFEHPGINIASIIRASIANFRAGHVVQGGSTITQQVAKSLLLTPEKTFGRKIKEVILASRLEKNLTKQQILFLYLNQIYLGHGAYGIQAASRTYFRKDANLLTTAEAALLAGMPQAPGKYSPLLNPKRAKERQLYVLRRLYENKYITQSEMTDAAAKPLKVYHEEVVNSRASAYLIEHLRRQLVEKYGEDAVYEEGLTIRVPTSPELAAVATKSLKEGLRTIDKRYGYRGALKHLNTAEEIETFLKEERVGLIQKRIQNEMLMPDGHIDSIEAMHQAGFQSDPQLLQVGEIYQGVVTSLDEKKKSAGVMIGGARVDLPADRYRWTNTVLNKLLQRGDVILVRVEAASDQAAIVSLEQDPQVQGALFSMDVDTGNVLAMEGGYDYDQSEFNRAIQAQRQPGSAFKPIIYASALEKGYTPASIIVDSPIVYQDADSKWKPHNFEEKFYGDTTFRQALIKSRNVPTIKIVQNVGVNYVINYAKRLGFESKFPEDLSISLGSMTVSLADITKVYALFPRMGRKVEPIYISSIVDRDGKTLEETKPVPLASPRVAPQPVASPGTEALKPQLIPNYPIADDPDQILDPRVAYVMTHLMNEVVTYGTGHDAKALGRSAAGKTGTTEDCQDAWFMGFTAHVVTGVWVGYDNLKTIGRGETGARAALPIWLSYMKEAVKNFPDAEFVAPPGIAFASIDAQSGKLAPPNSSRAIQEAFIEGTQPTGSTDGNGDPSENQPESQGDFFKEDTE